MENNTIEITVEEFKSLIEAKVLVQNAERYIENREVKSAYIEIDILKSLLGIEE